MRLFGKKKQEESEDASSDEGIVGVFVNNLAKAEGEFSKFVVEHLQRVHEPGGYAREKRENDFMDLGMKMSYLDALDDIEFTVEDTIAAAQWGIRRRGHAQVVTLWTVHGVHNRPLLGAAPSGEQVTVAGVSYTTFRNYKIRVEYTYWELPELTRRMVER